MPKIVDHDAQRRIFAEAAMRIIAHDGFEGMTMRGVAAESGLSYGSLFHYFKSKDDLLLEAVRLTMAAQTKSVNRYSAEHGSLDALTELLCDDAIVDQDSRQSWTVWNAFLYKASFDSDFATFHTDLIQGWVDRIAGLMFRAQQAGELQSGLDIPAEALAVWAFTAGIGQQGLLHPGMLPPEVQRGLVVDYVARLKP